MRGTEVFAYFPGARSVRQIGTPAVTAELHARSDGIGCSMHLDIVGTNSVGTIKASAGNLYGLEAQNPNTADAWLQIFDAAPGDISLGTTEPNLSLIVPRGVSGTHQSAMDKDFGNPIGFATAICYAVTSTGTGNGGLSSLVTVNALFR